MTADDRYRHNLDFFATHPSEALRAMPAQLATVPLTNIQLLANGKGQLVGTLWDPATQGWFGLCQFDDPEAEAERDVAAIWTPQAKLFTLIGLGLGYIAVALAKRLRPYQRLSIWEPSPVLYKAMLHAVDAAPLFRDARVQLFIGPGIEAQVDHWWLSLQAGDKLGIAQPLQAGYTSHVDKAAYDVLLEKTAAMLRHHMVGLATWHQFGRHIGDNDLRNLPEYVQSPGYETLAGLWANRPAVCVAAGPSLQKNLAVLLDPAVRRQVALLTVGTTYALLQGLHLHPDVVTTIDFQRLNWTDQFAHVPLDPDCPLVYLHSTYPQTPRRWPGPRFVAENGSAVLDWLRPWVAAKGSAAEVQTVAHLNVLVALALGANPICLVGQDLAMPPTLHHAAGARAQDQAPCEVGPDAFVQLSDYRGRPTASRHSFLSMRTIFERLAAAHPGHQFVNCTEGGLPLAGIPNMPLTEALAPYRDQTPAPELRQAIRRIWQGWAPTVQDGIVEAFAQLRHDVEVLLRVFCPGVLRHQQRRERPVGGGPDDNPVRNGQAAAAERVILRLESLVQTRQTAFNLFVIRDFRLVEILSTVPTGEAWLRDAAAERRCNADRLVALARVMHAIGDDLRQVLREAERRLRDAVQSHDARSRPHTRRECVRAFVRQHYGLVAQWLTDEKTPLADTGYEPVPARQQAHLLGQYFYHTQQYAAALALLEPRGLAPGHVAQMRQRLVRYADDVRGVVPRYFEQQSDGDEGSTSTEAALACGAYWGA